jgi:hypothetical protein
MQEGMYGPGGRFFSRLGMSQYDEHGMWRNDTIGKGVVSFS